MAATPESLILQHKHPFASSKNSSVSSAVGSSAEETLMVLAKLNRDAFEQGQFLWI